MFEVNGMMKTEMMLEHALDAEAMRRRVIANNIANVDVPNFKRSEVNFESELKRALDQNRQNTLSSNLPAKMTDSRHIPFTESRDLNAVRPELRFDYNTTYRNDGNNVDIEREMVDANKNQMRYNAFLTVLGGSYRNLKMVMRTA